VATTATLTTSTPAAGGVAEPRGRAAADDGLAGWTGGAGDVGFGGVAGASAGEGEAAADGAGVAAGGAGVAAGGAADEGDGAGAVTEGEIPTRERLLPASGVEAAPPG
jgi:streptogrisin D